MPAQEKTLYLAKHDGEKDAYDDWVESPEGQEMLKNAKEPTQDGTEAAVPARKRRAAKQGGDGKRAKSRPSVGVQELDDKAVPARKRRAAKQGGDGKRAKSR